MTEMLQKTGILSHIGCKRQFLRPVTVCPSPLSAGPNGVHEGGLQPTEGSEVVGLLLLKMCCPC